MKKILAVFFVVIMLLGMVGCDSNRLKGENSKFIVPKKAVTTVRVVINPAFNLYLDTEDNVVAIEPLNEDAKDIETIMKFHPYRLKLYIGAAKKLGVHRIAAALDSLIRTDASSKMGGIAGYKAVEMFITQNI